MKGLPSQLRRYGLVVTATVASTLVLGLDPGIASAHVHGTRAHAAAAAHVRHAGARAGQRQGRRAALITKAGAAASLRPTVTPSQPTCSLGAVNNRAAGQIRVFGRDRVNGVASIIVVNEVNDPVHVPAFTAGSLQRVPLILRKTSKWQPSSVTLRVTNTMGAATTCTFTYLRLARNHPQRVGQLSPGDHVMMSTSFGVRSMVMRANGGRVSIIRMGQRTRIINLNQRFNRANNGLQFWGVRGSGDAFVVVWDGSVGQSRMVN